MRNRLGAVITVGLVLVAGLTGVALAAAETVADDFGSGGYGGSTGTMEWTGNWVEVGESNGPGSGAVQVQADGNCASGQCLTISQLLGLSSIGAMRSLDLSEATSASLTYHVGFPGGLLLDGSAVVEARADGGAWNQLRSHDAGTDDSFTADLPVGHSVGIRLRAADLALTASMAFDDVSVEVHLLEPTTTSSTTTSTTALSITPPTIPEVSITPPTIPTVTLLETSTTTLPTTPATTLLTTPTTTGQGDDPPVSGDEPTTTLGGHRPPDDPGTTTTSSQPSGDGAPTTTTPGSGRDEDATTAPPSTRTTSPGLGATSESGSASVVTDFDPGLRSESVGGLGAQENLLVVFGHAVEDIALDLLASAVLGLVLAWASLRRLG